MTPTPKIAGWHERLFANIIDTLCLLLPASLVVGLLSQPGEDGMPVPAPASLLLVFLLNAAYYTISTSSNWQATPGKRLMNIHVVRADGRLLTQRDAFERFLAYVLPSLPIYTSFIPHDMQSAMVFGLSIAWFLPILTRPDRKAIHDTLCHTRVVSGRRGT